MISHQYSYFSTFFLFRGFAGFRSGTVAGSWVESMFYTVQILRLNIIYMFSYHNIISCKSSNCQISIFLKIPKAETIFEKLFERGWRYKTYLHVLTYVPYIQNFLFTTADNFLCIFLYSTIQRTNNDDRNLKVILIQIYLHVLSIDSQFVKNIISKIWFCWVRKEPSNQLDL